MSVIGKHGLRRRSEPIPQLSPLWGFVGGVLALAGLGYAFVWVWLSLPAWRWTR